MIFGILGKNFWTFHVIDISNQRKNLPHLNSRKGINILLTQQRLRYKITLKGLKCRKIRPTNLFKTLWNNCYEFERERETEKTVEGEISVSTGKMKFSTK